MKTDELIALLAKDTAPVAKNAVPSRILLFALASIALALGLLLGWLGVRPDMEDALHTSAYWMKTIYTAGLAASGFLLVERLARPDGRGRSGLVIAAICVAIIGMLGVAQLLQTPADQMGAALLGSSYNKCPWRILALAIPGIALILWSMRRFAPANPLYAGAAAGLLAGGLAATIYGLYCQETAAPFVAIWYSLGIALSGGLGAIAGSRILRW